MPGGLYPPPAVIASWPKPNYVNPVTHGNALTILSIIFPAIGLLLVSSRLYSRLFITKAPGLDDVLIVIALGFGIALSVLILIAEKDYYVNRHIWDIPLSTASDSRQNTWISEWCYVSASSAVKISILLFYRRLSVTFSKPFLIATWVGITYNLCYLFVFLLLLCLECRPVSAYWLQFSPNWLEAGNTFTCLDPGESLSLPLSAAFSVLGDFYSTMLPLGLVYFLDLPRRQKIALYGLFALGFLVVGAGITRTYLLNYVINKTYDVQWALWRMWIWTLVELYLAIFAASAPALKPFFRKFFLEPISDLSSASARQRRYLSQHSGTHSRGRQAGGSDGTTLHGDELHPEMDVEKIGVAVPLDRNMEMSEYQHKRQESHSSTTESSFPIQYPPRVNQSIDLQSDVGNALSRTPSQARSTATGRGSSEWILPPVRISDQDTLRQYRAEIEALPPLPPGKAVAKNSGEGVGKQTPPRRQSKRPSTQMSGSTIVAAVGGTGTRPSSQAQRREGTPNFARPLSSSHERRGSQGSVQGSVRAQMVRARQIQVAMAQEVANVETETEDEEGAVPRDANAGSRLDLGVDLESGSESSEDEEQRRRRRTWRATEFREGSIVRRSQDGAGSSQETLGLPRQGSRDDFRGGAGGNGNGNGRVGLAF